MIGILSGADVDPQQSGSRPRLAFNSSSSFCFTEALRLTKTSISVNLRHQTFKWTGRHHARRGWLSDSFFRRFPGPD